MYFAHNIAIYKRPSEEVKIIVTSAMQSQGFDLVNNEIATQVLKASTVDIIPEIDEGLIFRKFFVSPYRNQWCIVYPSTGWFSEVQELSVTLSEKLGCVALLLLVDDSAGWGYEISYSGQIIDRFHTRPASSQSLREKSEFALQGETAKAESGKVGTRDLPIDITTLARLVLPTSEQLAETKRDLQEDYAEDKLTPEQEADLEDRLKRALDELRLPTRREKAELAEESPGGLAIRERLSMLSRAEVTEAEKYRGDPTTVATLFDVAEVQIADLLSKSRNSGFGSHNEMRHFAELLSIKDFDATYQELVQEDFVDAHWAHLIFARRMSNAQSRWYESQKADFPWVSPPLWLDDPLTDR